MKFDFPEIMHEVPTKDVLKDQFGDMWWLARRLAHNIVLRTQLSEAQNHRCCHCGVVTNTLPNSKQRATIEHVLAQVRGGKFIFEHCAMACSACNNKRGSKVLEIEREFFPDQVARPRRERNIPANRRYLFKTARESALVFMRAGKHREQAFRETCEG